MPKKQFLYMKIYQDLKSKIENGELAPGSRMPDEEELCRQYGVSAITMKHAMQMLAGETLICRVPRKGTFVAECGEQTEKRNSAEQEEKVPSSTRKEKLIGVILEYAMPSFGINLMFELDKAARALGYRMCLRFSYADRERETEEIQFLLGLGIEGLIILPCHGFYYNTAILELVIKGFPVVILDKKMDGIQVPSIRTDNVDAVYQLVDYLKEEGKTRIGLITVEDTGTIALQERKKAFCDRIDQLRLPVMEMCILPQTSYQIIRQNPIEDYVKQIADYLKRCGRYLDGVVCTEFGNLLAYAEAEKRVGDMTFNILPCCVDSISLCPGGPRYPHIEQDETAMAARTLKILQKQMKGETIAQEEIKIPGILRA